MTNVYDEISTGEQGIARDRWGRPMVVPPGSKKAVAYTRVTTYAGAIEDQYGLQMWHQRMTALGLTKRPDLLLAVSAHANDKDELNKIVDQAREAAAASAAATTGTALHKLAERYDRGELALSDVPESHRGDLEAYATAMKPFIIHGVEQFLVLDELEIGGTTDRIVEYDGQRYIADIKTGSIEYGAGKMATQLALYARGKVYDPRDPTRREETGVSHTAGILIHLPAGQARCDLHWVDLKAGWESVDLCGRVRDWRKRKGFLAPAAFAVPDETDGTDSRSNSSDDHEDSRPPGKTGGHGDTAVHPVGGPLEPLVPDAEIYGGTVRGVLKPDTATAAAVVAQAFPGAEVTTDLADLITATLDGAELEALWLDNRDRWTAEHTALAKRHKTHLHQQRLRDAVQVSQ